MSDSTHSDSRYPPADDTRAQTAAYEAGRSASSNRWLLYGVGIVSILAGAVAILMPFLGTLTAAFVAGAALIASGIAGLFTAFRRHEGWYVAAAFALALLSIAVGIMIFLQPVAGIFALTTLVIAWFGASGILRVWYGLRSFGDGGGWMAAFGILAIVVAIMLWFGLPFSATWVLGVLLGVDLIMWGSIMIALAVRAGRRRDAVAD